MWSTVLTVSSAPLSSQFCWTTLAPSPSLSSAPAELCPPHLPSSRHRNHPWTPRPRRSLSRSWRTSCYSLNQTPHLKIRNNSLAKTANVQLLLILLQIAVTQTNHHSILISISYIKPDQILRLYIYSHFAPLTPISKSYQVTEMEVTSNYFKTGKRS